MAANLFKRIKQNLKAYREKGQAQSNLDSQLGVRFANEPLAGVGVVSQRWSTLNPEEKQYLSKRITNAQLGFIKPNKFIKLAHDAATSPSLNTRLTSLDKVTKEVAEQLTPTELGKVKDVLNDNVLKKVHERLLNQDFMYDVNNMRNLFKR